MTDLLLALVMLINFRLLGSGRIRVIIHTAAFQGVLISAVPLLSGHALSVRLVLLTVGAGLAKGLLIPHLLLRAFANDRVKREVEPPIGYVTSLVLCAAATGLALLVGRNLPIAAGHASVVAVPASLASLFTGLLLLMTRTRAITQATGYLVLENGITIFGLLMVVDVPFFVESSVLLDLVAGVFVMVIVMGHLNRTFTSLDTRQLNRLKEE